jgi:hypothetical protein
LKLNAVVGNKIAKNALGACDKDDSITADDLSPAAIPDGAGRSRPRQRRQAWLAPASLPELWPRLEPRERNRLRLLRLYQRMYRLAPEAAKTRRIDRGDAGPSQSRGRGRSIGRVRAAAGRLFDGAVLDLPSPVDLVLLATSAGGPTAIHEIWTRRSPIAWPRR